MIEVVFSKTLDAMTLDVDFTAPSRGITAVFGRNGSGKSSILSAVAGALQPDTGRIAVDDRVFFEADKAISLPVEKRRIGYVFQDSRLFPHFSVEKNLHFGLKRFSGAVRIAPDDVISLLGLAPLLGRRPHALSGGERQRVAIGRALLSQPALLLMDEPLAALDPPRKAEVLPYIESVRDKFDVPVLYISHDFDEVMRLADTLVLIDAGRVVRYGPLLDLASDPELAPQIGRFEAGTVLNAIVKTHKPEDQITVLEFSGGEIAVPYLDASLGTEIRVRVRARDVALALHDFSDISISNRLAGRLSSLTAREGPFVDAAVAVGDVTFRSMVTRATVERLKLEIGTPVWVLFKTAALDSRSVGFSRQERS